MMEVQMKKRQQQTSELGFEAAMAQLEDAVASLERGDLDLAAALERFEHGVALARRCRELLETAERRVRELDASGRERAFAEEQ
jgi:exodeoxyribonuclease VII small subunit